MENLKTEEQKEVEKYFFDKFVKSFLEAFKKFLDEYQEDLEKNRQDILIGIPQEEDEDKKEIEEREERDLLTDKVETLARNFVEIAKLSKEFEEDAKTTKDPVLRKEVKGFLTYLKEKGV